MTNAQSFVDNLAQQSDEILVTRPHLGVDIRVALSMLTEEGVQPKSAVDYGCGAGRFSVALAGAMPDVQILGLDLDRGAIEFARELSVEAGVETQCQFELVDLTKYEPTSSYDLACFFAVRELFESDEKLAMAGRKLTRQGGYWLVDGSWLVPEDQLNSLDQRLATFVEVVAELGGQQLATYEEIGSFDLDAALANLASETVPSDQIAARGVVSESEAEDSHRRLRTGIEKLTRSTVSASRLWLFRFANHASDPGQPLRKS